jgi:hypothetical protein
MFCYYEGMTVDQAKELYLSTRGKELSKKSIQTAITSIKRTTNKDWN